jgi:hypothetical protein
VGEYAVDANGCWIWQQGKRDTGYGRVQRDKRDCLAHRVYYERFIGPIPTGLTLDHLCRVRTCVNPAHLEPVTLAENKRRGMSPNAINARRTHCLRGHAFTEANTYHRPDKPWLRNCRACARMRDRVAWRIAGALSPLSGVSSPHSQRISLY